MKLNAMLALLGATLFVASANADALKIGVAPANYPWAWSADGENAQGYEIDVLKEVCETLNHQCTFTVQSWKTLFSSVRFGKFDIVAGGIAVNNTREKKLTLSVAHSFSPLTLITRKNNDSLKVTALNELGNSLKSSSDAQKRQAFQKMTQTIGVVRGENEMLLGELLPEAQIVNKETHAEVMKQLNEGNIDAYFTHESQARKLISDDKTLTLVPNLIINGKGVALAFRKGNDDLKQQIDGVINTLREEDKLSEYAEVWFDEFTKAAE